jgi:hypothetical protein
MPAKTSPETCVIIFELKYLKSVKEILGMANKQLPKALSKRSKVLCGYGR